MNHKPIDMKDLLEKLESISEADDTLWNADVHIKELAKIVLSKAESIARSRDLDRTTEVGQETWHGIISYQVNAVKEQLSDALEDARIEHEYIANQDARARALGDDNNVG